MKNWATCALGLVLASVAVMHAQWLNYKTPGVPRTADGKPKLDGPAPRALDGHTDLSGVWMHDLTPIPELRRLFGDNLPSYFGYSVGRWDRDTLVVDTTGFNDKVPLDFLGHPRSEQLHITERFRRRDYGHLDTEMTYNDPKFNTRPFTIRISYHLLADEDIFEMFSENEKDCAHIGKAQTK